MATGNDTITGGSGGHDKLQFTDASDTFASANITTNHHTGVTTVSFGSQTITVSGVETLVFGDGHTMKL